MTSPRLSFFASSLRTRQQIEDARADQAYWAARNAAEDNCPGHYASDADAKVCGNCGVHIDSLR